MEQPEKNQIVLAAISAAGPVGDDPVAWNARVLEMAAKIVVMTSPKSDVMKHIDSVSGAVVYTATLLAITKEPSSTRGLLKLRTKVSEHAPDGVEELRTERTDSAVGLAMARRCRALVGHRVVVWKDVQKKSNGTGNVRVIAHIEDLGEAEEVDAA